MIDRLADLWCEFWHDGYYWPRTDGMVECRTCHRLHPNPCYVRVEATK